MKLPADKRKKILERIDRFIEGKYNVVSGKLKKTLGLYNTSEVSSLTGSVTHYGSARLELKPYMTPFYRLFDLFPKERRHDKTCFRNLKIYKDKYLLNSLLKIRTAVDENKWIPFSQVARGSGVIKSTFLAYTDAAGEKVHFFNENTFGMGGLCLELDLVWQCPRRLYVDWLLSAGDTQRVKDSIMTEELLAAQFQKWLICKFHGKRVARSAIICTGDNDPVNGWLIRNRAKHSFQSCLVALSDVLSFTQNVTFLHSWISSQEMEWAGADILSRYPRRFMFGRKVLRVNRQLFLEFKTFFHSGMTG